MKRWIKTVFTCGPRILFDNLFYFKKYAKNPEKYSYKERYERTRKLTKKVSKGLKVDLFVTGLENIEENKNYLMVSNHLSGFDPLASLMILDKNTTFVSKHEAEKYFVVNNIVKAIEGLFMDRNNLKQSLKVMLKVQNELENDSKSWIIYPEGTRNKDPMALLQDFHSGTFRSAIKAKKDIIPIAIYGTQRVLKISKYKKLPVHISILPALKYEDIKDMSTDDISNLTNKMIQREVSFSLRKKDHSYMLRHNRKSYKFNKID